MKCPFCGHGQTAVLESRISDEGDSFRRRRECEKCKKRFTTYERIEGLNLVVVKKDGRREGFDREKLKRGLLKACEKRPVKTKKIEAIVEEIEGNLRGRDSVEIPSQVVGSLVMRKLKKLDKVAYIRFVSVYRSFADLDDFEKELKNLVKK